MHYCYILKSIKSNKYYIGSAKNAVKRLAYHNSGRIISTKHDRPWEIVHTEEFRSLRDARSRELQIKKWKSRKAIERLLKYKNLVTKSRILDSRNGNRDHKTWSH